jgi:PKD repeat protein
VTATGTDGTQASASVQVTSSGASPTRVTGTPLQGIAPLTVTFSITSDQPIQSVNGEFAAGSPFSVSPFNGTLSFTYQQPGAHTAIFNVVRADGTTVTKTLRIGVQSVEQVDQQLRQVWSGLTSALVRGDKAQAMQYLSQQVREKYGPVFDALLPIMTQIPGSFSGLQTVTIDGALGEYAVNRTIDGVNRIFFIYFLRDTDGVWRADSM